MSSQSDIEIVDNPTGKSTKIVVLKPSGTMKHLMEEIYIDLGIKNEITVCRSSFLPPPNLESGSSQQQHPISFISRSAHALLTTEKGKLYLSDKSGRSVVHKDGAPMAIGEVQVGDSFSLLPNGSFEYKVESFNPAAAAATSPRKKRRSTPESEGFEILEVVSKKPKVLQDLMEEVECAICFQPMAYSYMMPCQHTYCYECLSGHAASSARISSGGNKANFSCAVCSKSAKMKECVPNLKLDNVVEVLLSAEGGIEYSNHQLRTEYGKELRRNPNTNKAPPKLASPKPFVPQKTTNVEKVAREQKRANRKANRSLNPVGDVVVLDLT